MNTSPDGPEAVVAIHELYCYWTGQKLPLRFDRERLWHDFLRAGFGAEDLRRVIGWLQKEIRKERRHPGALKLSNLLQLDRFEEDLHLSRARMSLPPEPAPCSSPPVSPPAAAPHQRAKLVAGLRNLRHQLRDSRRSA
jgi:hypothetical protein